MRKRSTISIIYAEAFVFVEKKSRTDKLLKLSYDQENRKSLSIRSIRSLVAVNLRH